MKTPSADLIWLRCVLAAPLLLVILFSASCSKDAKKKDDLSNANEEAEEQLEAVDPNPEPAELAEEIEPEAEPDPGVDETSLVSFLGYHDFTETRTPTEMRIRKDKFRKQMQMLKDANVEVISIDDYLAWRRGEINIPKRCVVITADDGWREVHSHALPILKEFGYPFTVYLYTNFLDAGGRTLSQEQVEEIMANGGTIGSHSINHRDMNQINLGTRSMSYGQFERTRTAYNKGLEALDAGAEQGLKLVEVNGVKMSRPNIEKRLKEMAAALEVYDEKINAELLVSKETLERKFKTPVKTFAYPYGPYNDRIIKKAFEIGYEAMITVNGAKANFESALGEIPRFIVHGGDDRNWNMATNFGGSGGLDSEGDLLNPGEDDEGVPKEVLVRVTPANGELIGDRQPRIIFDFTKLEGVDTSTLKMQIGGFGTVPATLNAEKTTFSWQLTRKLRNETCSVQVSFQQNGKPRRVAWVFSIDKVELYTPNYRERYEKDKEEPIRRAIPVEG